MFHDDAVFDFPFGAGGPVRIQGKAAMTDYLAKIAAKTVFGRFDLKAAYPIHDSGIVLEYHSNAHIPTSCVAFGQDYIAVVLTSRGRITFYREYLNPLNIPGVADGASNTPLNTTPLLAPVVPLEDVLRTELGDRLDPAATTFLDMLAEKGFLQCPFAPPGALHRLSDRDAITDYFKQLIIIQGSDGMILTARNAAEDPARALLEYDGMVRNLRDGGTYR